MVGKYYRLWFPKEESIKVMKVFIGKYRNWWGPYEIANLLQKVNVSEDRCDKLGDWLADTRLSTFCNWIYSKRNRTVKVRIDVHDTWSMDSTLAYIILPMLKQLRRTTHGASDVDDKDVPKVLRSTSAPVKENEWDIDDNCFDRWDWVLDEMIWAFGQVNEDWEEQYHNKDGEWHFEDRENDMREIVWDKKPVIDKKGLKAHRKRMRNGFRLFGKYYSGLWD